MFSWSAILTDDSLKTEKLYELMIWYASSIEVAVYFRKERVGTFLWKVDAKEWPVVEKDSQPETKLVVETERRKTGRGLSVEVSSLLRVVKPRCS